MKNSQLLILNRKRFLNSLMDVFFAEEPFEVEGCDAVTFIECKKHIVNSNFQCQPALTAVIDLTPDIETVWQGIDKKSNRQRINRAVKDGVTIEFNQDFEEFFIMNKNFMKDKGFYPLFGVGVPSLSEMKKYATLITAKYEGEILAGHLYLENADCIRLWLSASKRLSTSKNETSLIGKANRLLHWEAMKYGKAKGLKEFDWGGVTPEEIAKTDPLKNNINVFKLSFGAKIVPRYSYSKSYAPTYKLARKCFHLIKYGANILRPQKKYEIPDKV